MRPMNSAKKYRGASKQQKNKLNSKIIFIFNNNPNAHLVIYKNKNNGKLLAFIYKYLF